MFFVGKRIWKSKLYSLDGMPPVVIFIFILIKGRGKQSGVNRAKMSPQSVKEDEKSLLRKGAVISSIRWRILCLYRPTPLNWYSHEF